MANRNDITLLLKRMDDKVPGAMDELMRVVYDDLERMAASQIYRQFGDQMGQLTLEPAALVNESFLELIKQRKGFDNRGHFFSIATTIMLRVLIDYRRKRMAAKRGGALRVTLTLEQTPESKSRSAQDEVDVESLAGALEKLELLDARKADIVKMRMVWGMTVPEVANALDVSPSLVDRDWKFAKAWITDQVRLTGG